MSDPIEKAVPLGGLAHLGIATETSAPATDEPALREFVVPMRVTKSGADAFVMATDEDDARAKAEAGQWERLEDAGAECVDWVAIGPAVENV